MFLFISGNLSSSACGHNLTRTLFDCKVSPPLINGSYMEFNGRNISKQGNTQGNLKHTSINNVMIKWRHYR